MNRTDTDEQEYTRPVMSKTLGKLERVKLRDVWEDEAKDFTPWLAKEENISLLGEDLGMKQLEVQGKEQNVGPFRADILCRNMYDNSLVLIENQLEKTDHKHLGQLLTYAPGLDAATIIWIAEKFVEEHRAALDWLNEITDSKYRFFGLEIELWKIDNSLAAPKFNIISKPNDWTQSVKQRAQQLPETPDQVLRRRFWQALEDRFEETGCKIKPQKPTHNRMEFSIGTHGFKMLALLYVEENKLGVGLQVLHKATGADENFRLLLEQKEEIENAFGHTLEWLQNPNVTLKKIMYFRDADLSDEDEWPEYIGWMRTNLEKVDDVFRERIRALGDKE